MNLNGNKAGVIKGSIALLFSALSFFAGAYFTNKEKLADHTARLVAVEKDQKQILAAQDGIIKAQARIIWQLDKIDDKIDGLKRGRK